MSVYAYLCALCRHLSSDHRLRSEADGVTGPYDCRECSCEITQSSAVLPLDRAQYERFVARFKQSSSATETPL